MADYELSEEEKRMVAEANAEVERMQREGGFTDDPRVRDKQDGPVGEPVSEADKDDGSAPEPRSTD